jgi:hypothetical protein
MRFRCEVIRGHEFDVPLIWQMLVAAATNRTATGGFDGEWYVGIAYPDGTGNVYAGAMLSFAPGFDEHPSSELLAGSYTSQRIHTETPTNFKIAPNTWYDLAVSWTLTLIKYYAAVQCQP